MVKNAQDIIIKPIITERSMEMMAQRKYTFKVDKNANKIEIARAVESVFGVSVLAVNTMIVKGRLKRQGRSEGYTPDWKKAIVTLKVNSKTIEFFEGMV